MTEQVKPETYILDVVGDNGTPFRFVYELGDTVRYYDRRYPTLPDEPYYHPRNYSEHGQSCGPDMLIESFTDLGTHGIFGWHEVEAWDIDAFTRDLVGVWLKSLKERQS
jgi:hypothetical protein